MAVVVELKQKITVPGLVGIATAVGLVVLTIKNLLMAKGKSAPADLRMWGQSRYVYVRGYTFHVTVYGKTAGGDYVVQLLSSDRTEKVPEHNFYHRNKAGFLELRDSVEFKRSYPDHPVHVEALP